MDSEFGADSRSRASTEPVSRLGPSGFDRGEGFTPGPWEVHSGYLVRKCDDDGVCCPIAEMRAPYRNRVGLVRGYKEEWHNARLIAAAPALYEACSEMVRLSQMTLEESLREPEENGNYAAFNRAVAALKQARGESTPQGEGQ